MQKRYQYILCILAVFCAAAMGCGTKTVEDSEVIMEIAGQPVVKAEYQMIVDSCQAEIKQQYDTDTVNSKDFWDAGKPGERPLNQAMQLARETLVHNKTVAQLAKEKGITTDLDYLSLAAQQEGENDRRQELEESGGTLYGITAFGLREYYDYAYTQAEYELTEILKGEQEISDGELQAIYEENQQEYTSEVSVDMLIAEMAADVGNEQAAQVAEDLREHTDLPYLAEKYPAVNFYELTMSSLNMQEGKSGAYMQRWLTASDMQQGEVCEPFAIGENVMVMRCLKRSEQAVQPFEEVKGLLKDSVQSGLAYEEMQARQEEAEVELKVSQEQLEAIAKEALQPAS